MLENRSVVDTGFARLARPLQGDYFIRASKESEELKVRLKIREEKIKQITPKIQIRFLPQCDSITDLTVAAVDGSNTALCERLGARFGIYSAGYQIFGSDGVVDEQYSLDFISNEQTGDPQKTELLMNVLRTRLERAIACELLSKQVDLILIDGSFFGYQGDIAKLFSYGVTKEITPILSDLNNLTLKLINSIKTVGVIKRTRTQAIDGYIAYRLGIEHCLGENDKMILASIMPTDTLFTYEDLLGTPDCYAYLPQYLTIYNYEEKRANTTPSKETVLSRAKTSVYSHLKNRLKLPIEQTLQTKRYFLRFDKDVPPMELEAPAKLDIYPLIGYFEKSYNHATGLPLPIDLIDQTITLSESLSSEFGDEIQAQLLHDTTVTNKHSVIDHFAYLNPQKEGIE